MAGTEAQFVAQYKDPGRGIDGKNPTKTILYEDQYFKIGRKTRLVLVAPCPMDSDASLWIVHCQVENIQMGRKETISIRMPSRFFRLGQNRWNDHYPQETPPPLILINSEKESAKAIRAAGNRVINDLKIKAVKSRVVS